MPTLSQVAKFNRTLLPDDLVNNPAVRELTHPGDNYILSSEMVWAVLHAESLRQDRELWSGDYGHLGRTVVGMGVKQGIDLLWPDLSDTENRRALLAIRRHLKTSNNAVCLQQAKGSLRGKVPATLAEWWVSDTWNPDTTNPSRSKGRTPRKVKKAKKTEPRAMNFLESQMFQEAKASVALDGETQSFEGGAHTAKDGVAWPASALGADPAKLIDLTVNIGEAKFHLSTPGEDYVHASEIVWRELRRMADESGSNELIGITLPGVIRGIWPNLSAMDVGRAREVIRKHLNKSGNLFIIPDGTVIYGYRYVVSEQFTPPQVQRRGQAVARHAARKPRRQTGNPNKFEVVETMTEKVKKIDNGKVDKAIPEKVDVPVEESLVAPDPAFDQWRKVDDAMTNLMDGLRSAIREEFEEEITKLQAENRQLRGRLDRIQKMFNE